MILKENCAYNLAVESLNYDIAKMIGIYQGMVYIGDTQYTNFLLSGDATPILIQPSQIKIISYYNIDLEGDVGEPDFSSLFVKEKPVVQKRRRIIKRQGKMELEKDINDGSNR
jgi:hypothetical protein